MHLDDDPVDARVAAGRRQRLLQPHRLGVRGGTTWREGPVGVGREGAGVELVVLVGGLRDRIVGGVRRRHAAHVVGATALVADVVGVEADEQHRADLERVEAPLVRRAVAGEHEARVVRVVPVGAVVELRLVVADAGHPRALRRRTLDIEPEVAPHLGRRLDVGNRGAGRVRLAGQGVAVGQNRLLVAVAEVTVEQVEQRRQRLHLGHRVVSVPLRLAVGAGLDGRPVGQRVDGTGPGRGEIPEAGEGEGEAPRSGRGEGARERHRGVRGVGHGVAVGGARAEAGQRDVVGVHHLAAQAVGVGERRGAERRLTPYRRVDRDLGRGLRRRGDPRDGDRRGRVGPPGQVDLLRCVPRSERAGTPRAGGEGIALVEAEADGDRREPDARGDLEELSPGYHRQFRSLCGGIRLNGCFLGRHPGERTDAR